jgi:hypothetical protein
MYRLDAFHTSVQCWVDRRLVALALSFGWDRSLWLLRGRCWTAVPSVRPVWRELLRRYIASAPRV